MAKEKKVVREEETSVCFVEWRSGIKNDERKVLVIKRPEKGESFRVSVKFGIQRLIEAALGLLAGLFEFPAVDLPPPPAKEFTSLARAKVLQGLLSTLLINVVPSISDATSKATISGDEVSVETSTDLGAILQVYSHQKRIYHIRHIVITSTSLPSLAPTMKLSSTSKTPMVQSLPGRGKWIDFGDAVDGSNLGGAMIKVWDIVKKGKYSELKPRTKAKAPTNQTNGKGKAAKKAKSKDEYETEEEEDVLDLRDEDDPIENDKAAARKEYVKEAQRLEVESIREKIKLAKDAPSPAKKRKIVIAEDSDDEE